MAKFNLNQALRRLAGCSKYDSSPPIRVIPDSNLMPFLDGSGFWSTRWTYRRSSRRIMVGEKFIYLSLNWGKQSGVIL